ncbi:tetratricopeptide tpr-1 repeat-containing protein [Leptolyngbya sp. Heron Island J]|uniref:tetratricopeptide repeat protein n=1 Tax=Leptolyngbya sp. Heron Island J TaxID=1385935 RepID=UPI0003B98F50|nr:tetratricopeptide repeat protein [Leptolyngbya sp. Heron Island J]ESA36093.1 tetratricopeptide tpr-1 repeat-containing protein [Leptolyngbya sp. Heron Island J]
MLSSTSKPSQTRHLGIFPKASIDQQLKQSLHQAIQYQDYPRAILLLNYFIIQEPKNPDHYINRGLIYAHYQSWSQAMADYNQALQLNHNEGQIYANRAKCNAALGHWSEALADYDTAIGLDPDNINARVHQGILFRALSLYDDAIVCFGLALFIGNLSADIYAERGRTYQLDGQWNCAISDYQRALEILAESPSESLQSQIQVWTAELLPNQ